MSTRLARVRWAMGQTLLPQHLIAQEDAILAETAVRFSLNGLPGNGLADLQWNDGLLSDGILSIDSATLVFKSGLLIKVGGNAKVEPFNLGLTGGTRVPVYLHVDQPPEDDSADNLPLAADVDGVTCWLWHLTLSTEPDRPGTLESFKLAEFEKLPDGLWRPAARFIPPLLRVGTTPFLLDDLKALSRRLDAYHYQLVQEVAGIYLSGQDLVNARLCMKSVVQLQRFIANLLAQIHPHPYQVYEELRRFYVDLCFYHNATPQFATATYDHDRLAECFQQVLEPLQEQLTLSIGRSPYLSFSRRDGLVRAELPAAIREASEIYLLVQKARVSDRVPLEHVKIAAISRVPVVHRFALQGIPTKRLERPPFQHSFGPEVDIYHVQIGEEWDHALRESGLGFFDAPELAEHKFFLYWRGLA